MLLSWRGGRKEEKKSNSSPFHVMPHSRAAATAATAAMTPPAPLARLAPSLADAVDEELEVDSVLVPVAVPVVVAVAAVPVAVELPDVEVAATVLVDEYWLARAQYWLTRPL